MIIMKQPFLFLRPKTKQELADEYRCSADTIRRMCHEIGIFTRKRLTTREIEEFYHFYGEPEREYKDWKK